MGRRIRAFVIAGVFGSAAALAAEPAAAFEPPEQDDAVRWEAEQAAAEGWRTVERDAADGGAYVESTGRSEGEPKTLKFRFTAPERMTLRLWPDWWRHGQREPARRYPHPLERQTGPGAVVAWDGTAFFTAPAAGRIGRLNAGSGAVGEPIELGGYPIDLLVHRGSGRLFVADAAGDAVVVLDPSDGRVVKRIGVPDGPWALAADEDRVFVACREARKLAVIDPEAGEVVREVSTPYPPRAIGRVSRDGEQRLVVRPMPVLYDPAGLEEQPADRFEFYAELRDRAAFPRPLPIEHPNEFRRIEKTFYSEEPGELQRTPEGDGEGSFDVREVTHEPGSVEVPDGYAEERGPAVLDEVDERLFFGAPLAGRVGIFDMEEDQLTGNIEVGGYVVDLVAAPAAGKVYAGDVTDPRIVVIDAASEEVVDSVELEGRPMDLARRGDRIVVAMRDPARLAAINMETDRLVRSVDLPETPLAMRRVTLHPSYARVGARRWQAFPAPSFEKPVRMLLRMPALAYEPSSLERVGLAQDQPNTSGRPPVRGNGYMMGEQRIRARAPSRQTRVAADGKTVTVGDTSHAIKIEGEWVDTSAVTDPHHAPEPARLGAGDEPGTIWVRMDDGPRLDWTRNIWITPDDGTQLVNGTDEFRRWNAPRITVGPGEHVLRVHARGRFARLDALRVDRAAEPGLALEIEPLPRETHGDAKHPGYFGTFAADEPPAFRVRLQGEDGERGPSSARLEHAVTDLAGKEIAKGAVELGADGDGSAVHELRPDLEETGIFHLTLRAETDRGEAVREVTFVNLPELDHPRLFARADQRERIRRRMEQHPTLFRRYREWLRWRLENDSLLPEKEKFLADYPTPEYKNEAVNKWPVFAVQAMAWLSEGEDREFFTEKVEPLLPDHRKYLTGHSFVHNAFPSVPVVLEDLRAGSGADLGQAPGERYAGSLGNTPNFAQSLMAVQRPLRPRMRSVLHRQAKWAANVRRYFDVHAGKRGGNWWLSTRTGCACPLQGVARALLFCRTFFDDDALFEGPALGGWTTHHLYVHPRYDRAGVFPSAISESTGSYFGNRVMRNLVPAIARHPMPPNDEAWRELIGQISDPSADEDHVRAMMDADPARSAMVPLFVALGWYDPEVPPVRAEDLPPTTLFDGEGEAVLGSSWEPDRTRLYFSCGVRDVVYRGRPGHVELMQAGRLLLGTGALGADHGQPVPSWGNTVVVGDRWRQWWQTNAGHPRGFRQNQVMRRHPPAKADYLSRDRRLIDYTSPASGKPYYGLGFHSHSRHPFIREGRIAAYETSPAFDYVAGDMTNAWRSQDVRSAYRQIVFVRPNVFVMYDRVRRGPEGGPVRWISATGPELSLGENGRFTIGNKDARLAGRFLMPRGVRVQQHDAWSDSGYSGFRWNTRQRILEARPADAADEGGGPVEFLTVMRTGTGEEPALSVTREIKDGAVKVRLTVGKDGEERAVSVAFDRSGSPAGRIRIEGGGQRIDRELAEEAEDTYDRWKEDPRWERWTSDPRFRFMRIGEED